MSVSSGTPPHPSYGTARKPRLTEMAVAVAVSTAREARSMPVSPQPSTSTRRPLKRLRSLYSHEWSDTPSKLSAPAIAGV